MRIPVAQLVWVALGGALGSLMRFVASGAVHQLVPGVLFPLGTLFVNVTGCLIIGALAGLAETRQFLIPDLRVFLFTGVLGGFTTYSAFALESLGLALDAAWWRFALNISAQILLGLGGAWAGYGLGRSL